MGGTGGPLVLISENEPSGVYIAKHKIKQVLPSVGLVSRGPFFKY